MQNPAQTDLHFSGDWQCLRFKDLSGPQVYQILQLRGAVFVVEQQCVYLDADGHDNLAWHMLYREKGTLLAYQRCLPPQTYHDEFSSLGRVAVDRGHRHKSLGRTLVARGIRFNLMNWPDHGIKISAQRYLQSFYESLAFKRCSEPYDDDGIEHIDMLLLTSAASDAFDIQEGDASDIQERDA